MTVCHCACMARHRTIPADNPLARFKETTKFSDEKIGDMLGLAREQVQRFRTGKRGPSLTTALRIQERSNGEIPVEAWGGTVAA